MSTVASNLAQAIATIDDTNMTQIGIGLTLIGAVVGELVGASEDLGRHITNSLKVSI